MNWIRTAALTTIWCTAASAASFIYTETQNGTGSLGGTPFNNVLVTLSMAGDTGAITTSSGVYFMNAPATVTVAGIGTANFTDAIWIFAAPGANGVGFSDHTVLGDVLDVQNAAFAAYNLSTAIGPITGTPTGSPSLSSATTLGAFILSSSSSAGHPATFTAETTAEPEPATFGLIGAGVLLLLVGRRRTA